MKKILIICFWGILPFIGYSQQMNQVVIDTTINEEILYGYCDRIGLESTFFAEYFNPYYDAYQANDTVIKNTIPYIQGVYFTIVFGSWCSDSQMQLPHFYKVTDMLGITAEEISLIGVNRQKEFDEIDTKIFDIELVPTIIVLREGKEIGRIVESPAYSIEEDLYRILSRTEQ